MSIASYTVLGFSGVQAGLIHRESRDASFFAKIYKIQKFINYANISCIFFQLGQAGLILAKRHIDIVDTLFLKFSLNTLIALSVVTGIVWVNVAAWTNAWVYRLLHPNEKWKDQLLEKIHLASPNHIDVEIIQPSSQVFTQVTYLTQMAANTALAYLTTSPYFYLTCAAIQTHNFIQTARWKWVALNLTHPIPMRELEISMKISSYWALRSFSIDNQNDICSICHDNPPDTPLVPYCIKSKHLFHPVCMLQAIYTNIVQKKPTVYRTPLKNGRTKYTVIFNETSICPCPLCRARPSYHGIDVLVTENDLKGTTQFISATVNFIP